MTDIKRFSWTKILALLFKVLRDTMIIQFYDKAVFFFVFNHRLSRDDNIFLNGVLKYANVYIKRKQWNNFENILTNINH